MKIETGDGWELRRGSCLDPAHGLASLADDFVDHVIVDPPYSARTHDGQRHERDDDAEGRISDDGLGYDALDAEGVRVLSKEYDRVSRGWNLVMTSHDLWPLWEHEMKALGRYVFAPLPIVIPGMNVRLQGDGPSNWTVWLVVSRPRVTKNWGTKPGAYCGIPPAEKSVVKGAKHRLLLDALVRDYTIRGDTILDSHVGSGTTGIACLRLGRRFVGWEVVPKHGDVAMKNLRATKLDSTPLFDTTRAMQITFDTCNIDDQIVQALTSLSRTSHASELCELIGGVDRKVMTEAIHRLSARGVVYRKRSTIGLVGGIAELFEGGP